MYGDFVKKGMLWPLILTLLASFSASAEPKQIVLTPGAGAKGLPAQAISDWSFTNADLVKGYKGGKDITVAGASYDDPVPDIDPNVTSDTELLIHFDGASLSLSGDYRVGKNEGLRMGKGKIGPGSALFTSGRTAVELFPGPKSFFSPNRDIRDFSVEFWVCPSNALDGETILNWKSNQINSKRLKNQEISCVFSDGRLSWNFINIFSNSPNETKTVRLRGRSAIVPRSWTQHLLRFDSETGLLEYLVNGEVEDITHVTKDGHESATVYLPRFERAGLLEMGKNYTGLLDEFRITSSNVSSPTLESYKLSGARVDSPILDLGFQGSAVNQISLVLSQSGSQGVEYLARSGDSFGNWEADEPEWKPFRPDANLGKQFQGRYFQVRVDLFPDGAEKTSPQLSRILVTYLPQLPPAPPARVTAIAGNGTITLHWTRIPGARVKGYKLYYGINPREYFCADAAEGQSPIDVGDADSFTLTGLTNGRLYFMSVSSYDDSSPAVEGEFSGEVSARPLRVAE
jgi:hypothetical protein